MRPIIGLGFLLCGCQLLPQKTLNCADSDVCEPVVTAPFVLGQPDAQTNRFLTSFGSPASVMLTPEGKLFVSDLLGNRIMVWNEFPTTSYQKVSYVLGHSNASVPDAGTTGEFVPSPGHLTFDNKQLIAISADPTGMRQTNLYSWQPIPTQHTPPTSSFPLMAGTSTMPQPLLAGPGAPLVIGTRFYVTDYYTHRLLTWSTVPNMSATFPTVIGQANSGTMAGAGTFFHPAGLAGDATQFFVADSGNNRVLVWSAPPTTNTAASKALGQTSLMLRSSNQSMTPGASTLNTPSGVAVSGNHLAVADTGNNRVLLWNLSGPITMNAQPASLALGQPDLGTVTQNSGGISAARMRQPFDVATNGKQVAVSDLGNRRVLLWNNWPTASDTPADVILGQQTATENGTLGFTPANNNFLAPSGVARSAKGFFVVDSQANRVLIYATPPRSASESAIAVLGQFDEAGLDVSATTLFAPQAITAEGDALAVADTGDNRVAIWRNVTAQNQQPIDIVLGQAGMDTSDMNAGSASVGLNAPQGVFLHGGKLYVADTNNNRVLIWNSLPTQNQQAADVVLGQADFTSTLQNRNGGGVVAADTLNHPCAIVVDDTSIYVSDTGAFRVLIWKTLTPTNGQPADMVLGHGTLTDGTTPSAVSDANLSQPVGLGVHGNRLYVADTTAHRIVYYDLNQLTNGMSARGVYGQADLLSGIPNRGGLDIDRLSTPLGVLASETGLYIADANNSRIVVLPPTP